MIWNDEDALVGFEVIQVEETEVGEVIEGARRQLGLFPKGN